MPAAWSKKRERQYEHIKDALVDRGESRDEAEEIAARTVNKERARAGEAKESSRTSTEDISSGRRGGLRSHQGPGGPTRDQLYAEARRKGIKGRSKMTKAELTRAVDAWGWDRRTVVWQGRGLGNRQRDRAAPRGGFEWLEDKMALWVVLLIAALVAAVIGFGTAAKWLFIIAVILLVIGLVGLLMGNRRSPV
jgi:hypothetical protein